MTKWFDEAVSEKLHAAGNHVILIPAQNTDAPVDSVDIYDGITGQFIVAGVPEDAAYTFAKVWNDLVDSGENTELAKKINIAWLTDYAERHSYNQ